MDRVSRLIKRVAPASRSANAENGSRSAEASGAIRYSFFARRTGAKRYEADRRGTQVSILVLGAATGQRSGPLCRR